MSTDENIISSKIKALEALIESSEDKDSNPFTNSEWKSNPEFTRAHLSILVDREKYNEALEDFSTIPLNKRWSGIAIYITGYLRDRNKTIEILEWASSNLDDMGLIRCKLNLLEGALNSIQKSPKESPTPVILDKEERNFLEFSLEQLDDYIKSIKKKGVINVELEKIIVEGYLRANRLLGKWSDLNKVAILLIHREPISFELPLLALNKVVIAGSDWPDRLRNEYPKSIDAKILALALEGTIFNQIDSAYEEAQKLLSEVTTISEKERVFLLMYQFYLFEKEKFSEKLKNDLKTELAEDSLVLKKIKIGIFTHEGKLSQAISLLESIKNEKDPEWIQLYAVYLLKSGDRKSAEKYFNVLIENFQHPLFLHETATFCDNEDLSVASSKAFEKLTTLSPDDINLRASAAMLAFKTQSFAKAAEHLNYLAEYDPENLNHQKNRAISLCQAGKLEESLSIYESIWSKEKTLSTLLGKAQVLILLKRTSEAFETLNEEKKTYWQEPKFIGFLMRASYLSNNEKTAHEAFEQLYKLQAEGKSSELIYPASAEDLSNQLKAHKQKINEVSTLILNGKVSWLLANDALGHSYYLGWMIRTQQLATRTSNAVDCGLYTIYSTNGFSALNDELGNKRLLKLRAAPRNSKIIVDLSALLTLQNLDLLSALEEYYSELIIPSSYIPFLVNQTEHMLPNQLSRNASVQEIIELIDNGKVSGNDINTQNQINSFLKINEFSDNDKSLEAFTIMNLVDFIYKQGGINDEVYNEISLANLQPAKDGNAIDSLKTGTEFLVELETLKLMSQLGILKTIADKFQINISLEALSKIRYESNQISYQENAQEQHKQLLEKLMDSEKYKPISVSIEKHEKESLNEQSTDTYLSSIQLAEDTNLPLFADDRLYQALQLNRNNATEYQAFGTDLFIQSLMADGLLSIADASDKMIEIIRKRYRFIFVPASILKHWIDNHKTYPPGKELKEIANYIHDCMADPGLFAGREVADPPTPMAFACHQEWIRIVAELISLIWKDDSYTNQKCKEITGWLTSRLIPSPPTNMGAERYKLSPTVTTTLIANLSFEILEIEDIERANLCLRSTCENLGYTDDKYTELMMEVLNVFEK